MRAEFCHQDIRKAQRGRCYLCAREWPGSDSGGGMAKKRASFYERGTKDHVRPRSGGNPGRANTLFVHFLCNQRKGNREPYPCELLYLESVHTIIRALPKRKDGRAIWPKAR